MNLLKGAGLQLEALTSTLEQKEKKKKDFLAVPPAKEDPAAHLYNSRRRAWRTPESGICIFFLPRGRKEKKGGEGGFHPSTWP